MNSYHDDRPPGVFRGAGYWVDQAWYSYVNDQRLAAMTRQRDESVVVRHPKRHYTDADWCVVCHSERPKLSGKCRRCYHREYHRTYYQRQQEHKAE